MRIAIAKQETLDAQRIGRADAAHKHGPALGVTDHAGPPQNIGAQYDFTDIGFGTNHSPEAGSRDVDELRGSVACTALR